MVKQISGGFRRFDHERVRLEFDEPSLTHQSFSDACDIRNIMAQYKRTGIIQHLTSATEILGDFTDVPDYRESLDIVIRAQEAFDALPSSWRTKFNNDPANFVDFCQDPNNRDEMIKLGMIEVQNAPLIPSKTSSEDDAAPSST